MLFVGVLTLEKNTMTNTTNIIEAFRNAMMDNGITPPQHINGDGQRHRFKHNGDKTANSWYQLHLNGIAAGNFGCWKLNINQNWCSKSEHELTPEERKAYREQCEQNRLQAEKERKQREENAANQAKKAYGIAAYDDVIKHPYAVSKGIETLTGALQIKCFKWEQRNWKNALIIPLINANNETLTLQAINENGTKDFLAGGKKHGCFYPFTDLEQLKRANIIMIGEGVATVGACHIATGYAAVAAMDAGNLMPVAQAIRSINPTAKIILLADNDTQAENEKPNTGVLKATEAAKAIKGYVAIPKLLNSEKCDFWSVYSELGKDSVKKTINAALTKDTTEAAALTKKPLFSSLSELISKPRTTHWLIKDYLEMNSTALLFGESGAGKSFAVLDMALSIATGKDWHGHPVTQGAVFYVAGEGQAGVAKRCLAWSVHHDTPLNNVPFFVSCQAINLPDSENMINLMAEIEASQQKPALIVFDTLARCLNGDENSASDTSAFIQALDTIRNAYGCCVLVVHHSGKDESKGARGSSALKAAMDTELGLTKMGDLKRLQVTKQKDHEAPNDKIFNLERAETTWLDDNGDIIYSAVMTLSDHEPTSKSRVRLTNNDELILESLKTALEEHGTPPPQAIKDRFPDSPQNIPPKVINIEHWREYAYQVMTVDSDSDDLKKIKNAKKLALQRARDKLEKLGYIGLYGGFAWIANN